ncbi:MAG: polysaccharide deacetylase family protein [Alphaproteobacteria bacterium]|nr:polysaccharide deacetylase family protein [Alphaproteobacteria bacterium]
MATVAAASECPGNPNALGVSRVVAINTTGGPGFGFQHYKLYDFLKPGEVVLTFDDGPLPTHTVTILKALKEHCVRATFFPVGKLAVGYPEILKMVGDDGHTVGSHTWSHDNIAGKKMTFEAARDQIEDAVSAVKVALGSPGAPFFRYPYLRDTPESIKYLAERNIAVFSTDLDSFDFKGGRPTEMVARVMRNLQKRGKGIILFHDIQKVTAQAIPDLLRKLKEGGFKIVHLTAKEPVTTLPAYDEKIGKHLSGRSSMVMRPLSSVVETVKE